MRMKLALAVSSTNINKSTNSYKMEEIPITGLEELEAHLAQIIDDPDTPLNAKLFDEVELQLNGMYFKYPFTWYRSTRLLLILFR